MKIGLAQMDIVWEDKKENTRKAEKLIQEACTKKVDYLLFPEMSLTGFSMNSSEIGENSKKSQTIESFSRLAKKYSIAIGIGYVENSIERAKNCFVIIDDLGETIAHYAKIHPFSYGEESIYYKGGSDISFAKIQEWITTPFICYDLRFPEIFQFASRKSQLITIAANWPSERREHWITLLRARAIENQCYIAGVNRVGNGNGIVYSGDSMIVDPYGEILSSKVIGEGIVTAKIEKCVVENYRESFRLKEDRQEKLYEQLRRTPI